MCRTGGRKRPGSKKQDEFSISGSQAMLSRLPGRTLDPAGGLRYA